MPSDTSTASGSPSTVVFDLGNVLITWDRANLYRQLIPDPAELDRFLDEVLTIHANALLDLGTTLPELCADLRQQHPDDAELISAFEHRWIETLGPTIDGSVVILEQLATAGVPLYALSNWGKDTFAIAQTHERLGFLKHFDGMVISGHEGVIKPDPAIYELLCERYAIEPTDAVFIDDNESNIEAADRLGFHTVLFTNPDDLSTRLRTWGLF